MATIVKELVTKWTYKVDASQIKKAANAIKGVKSEIRKTQQTSQKWSAQETKRIGRISNAWRNLRGQIRSAGNEIVRSNAKARASSKGGGIGGGFKGFAALRGMGVGAGAAAGLAAGPGIAALTGLAGSAMAFGKREQAEVGFEGFLKSGEKAKKLTAQLSEFASVTPLNIQNVRDMATEVLAMGGAYNEVIPILKKLGDVTGGNTERMQRALFNFLEVRNKQSADKVDLKQFVRAGIPIYQQLEKQLGKTKEELYAMVSAGEITGKIISEAFTRMTGKGGMFEDRMQKMSKTLLGRLSNLGDAIISLAENIGGIFGDETAGFIHSLSLFVEGLSDGAKYLSEIDWLFKALVATGAVLAAVFAPVSLIFAGLFLAIEDFIAYKQGRGSVFGLVFGDNGFFDELGKLITETFDSATESVKNFFSQFDSPLVRKVMNLMKMMSNYMTYGVHGLAMDTGIAPYSAANNSNQNNVTVQTTNNNQFKEGITPEEAAGVEGRSLGDAFDHVARKIFPTWSN